MTELQDVRFYGRGAFKSFSNFYGSIFTLVGGKSTGGSNIIWHDGLEYISAEHIYQATKFTISAPDIAEAIRKCNYGAIVYSLGHASSTYGINANKQISAEEKKYYLELLRRSKKIGPPADWNQARVPIMKRILHCKFRQCLDLKRLLLSTAGRKIIEASPRESFWGEGPYKSGQNVLGTLLVQVREEILAEEAQL